MKSDNYSPSWRQDFLRPLPMTYYQFWPTPRYWVTFIKMSIHIFWILSDKFLPLSPFHEIKRGILSRNFIFMYSVVFYSRDDLGRILFDTTLLEFKLSLWRPLWVKSYYPVKNPTDLSQQLVTEESSPGKMLAVPRWNLVHSPRKPRWNFLVTLNDFGCLNKNLYNGD